VNFSTVNDPHVAGGVVKHFLDDLSHPILTFDLYHCLIAAAHIENISMRIECLKQALSIMPAGNLAVLKRFFICMIKAESYQENKVCVCVWFCFLGDSLVVILSLSHTHAHAHTHSLSSCWQYRNSFDSPRILPSVVVS
jgi:RhoGAP domain